MSDLPSLLARADSVVRVKLGCLCALPRDESAGETDLRDELSAAVADGETLSIVSSSDDWWIHRGQTAGLSLRASRFTNLGGGACEDGEGYFQVSQLHPPLLLSASIDTEKQKYADIDFLGDRGHVSAPLQCEVAYNGFTYITADRSFREAPTAWLAQEVREQLSGALERSGKFAAVTIGPSPIRVDFLFLFFEDDGVGEGHLVTRGTGVWKGDWWASMSVARGTDVDAPFLHTLMADFFDETEMVADSLYNAGALRDFILDAKDHIQAHYRNIAETVSELYLTNIFNIPGRVKRTRVVERALSEVYRLMVGLKDAEAEREESIQYLRETMRESPTLRDLEQPLCAECVGPGEGLSDTFFEALRHAQSVTSLQSTYQSAVVAAILGGVTGALISPLGLATKLLIDRVK